MPSQRVLVSMLVACLGLLFAPPAGAQSAEDATYVFYGTVLDQGKTTLEGMAPTERSFVVRVEKVYFQKGAFQDQTGREITVLGNPDEIRPEGKYLFYTEPLVFGESLAVSVVSARNGEPREGGEVAKQMEESQMRRALAERVKQARWVVVATVADTRAVEMPQDRRGRETEHDPMWREATLKIDRTLKGEPDAPEVGCLFASSRDVQWYRAPKLEAEQKGVFLLHRAETEAQEMAPGLPGDRLVLIHPLDFQPMDMLPLIEELVP